MKETTDENQLVAIYCGGGWLPGVPAADLMRSDLDSDGCIAGYTIAALTANGLYKQPGKDNDNGSNSPEETPNR